jgi:hypothetical protein
MSHRASRLRKDMGSTCSSTTARPTRGRTNSSPRQTAKRDAPLKHEESPGERPGGCAQPYGQLSTDRASRSRVTVIFRRFCSSRSSTPDVCVLNAMTDSGRRSSLHSVTRLPDSVGSMR